MDAPLWAVCTIRLVLKAFSDDLAAVGDDHKSGWLNGFDITAKLRCLRTAHNSDDDRFWLMGEGAFGFIYRCTVVQFLHNIIADGFRIFTDDIW